MALTRLQQLWRYLLRGSDVQYLPRTWLADTERLAGYEAWTKRQWQQGAVVKDTAATARDRFWERLEQQHQARREQQQARAAHTNLRTFERKR